MCGNQNILIFFTLLFISSCYQKTYENQTNYQLKVNETVEIYYSTNSCCYYCFASEQNLNHIEYIEEKTVDSGPKDCAGCNFTAAYVFKAKSPGIDTVKLKHSTANESCTDANIIPEEYIIEVK